MGDIFEKCQAGEYENKLPWARPKEDRATWEAYQAETARLHGKFMEDLAADLGISDHPKRDLLLAKAWEQGHSAGYHEVANVAQDLVDLILDPEADALSKGGKAP